MAKMKQIFMEIYEKFDGQIPPDFDFDEYINQKIEQEKNKQNTNNEKN